MLVLLIAACGLVASDAFLMYCPPDTCRTMKCPDVSNCHGRVVPKADSCGCCDMCVTRLGVNESCTDMFIMDVLPPVECGPGLICDRTTDTCVKFTPLTKKQVVTGNCAQQQQKLNGLSLLGVQRLSCNQDGSFSPVQTQGSVAYCVDQNGMKIQGYEASIGSPSHATMNCQCARDQTNYMKTGLIGKLFFCDTNGNYKQPQH